MNPILQRILIVDDEPAVTQMLQFHLQQAGFLHVQTVNDPTNAINRVSEFKPDVLLLDISMPNMDGLQVLEELTDLVMEDSISVIMVTSCEQEHIKRKALILGAQDFISKPVDGGELVSRVTQSLAGRPNRDFILSALRKKN